jgi:hypothetical protein
MLRVKKMLNHKLTALKDRHMGYESELSKLEPEFGSQR